MLLFAYTTTHKRFVIFTCRYFKLSWNATYLRQSNRRNFSCCSHKYFNQQRIPCYIVVRTTNCRFDALGLVLNLSTLFLFCIKFATEIFFPWKLNSGWRALHFHGNLSVTRNFKKRLNPIWVANKHRCMGPIRIATVNDITRKIETLVLNTPQNPCTI